MTVLPQVAAEPTTHWNPQRFGWMVAAVIAGVGGWLSFLRVRHLLAWSYDLGFYVQDLFAIRAGQTINSIFGFGVFSDHVSPILAPLAVLAPSRWPGEFLVVLQAIVIALGVLPLVKLGELIAGRRGAILAGLWYGASAAVWHALMYDFHPVTLALPLAGWILLELEKGANGRPWWPLLATVLIREDVALLFGLMVVVAGLRSRRRTWWLAGGGAMLIGIGFYLYMRSQPGIGDHFWYRYGGEWSDLGQRLLRPDLLVSLSAVLIPLLVVAPFRGLRYSWPGLLLLASFAAASYDRQVTLYYQYFAQAVPFLIAGSIATVAVSEPRRVRLSIGATVLVFALLGPVVFIGYGLPDRFFSVVVSEGERAQVRDMLSVIPGDASVSATEMVAPALAWRSEIHPFPGPMICGNSLGYYTPRTFSADYVVLEPDTAPAGQDWHLVLPQWGYVQIANRVSVELWEHQSAGSMQRNCPPWSEQKAVLVES